MDKLPDISKLGLKAEENGLDSAGRMPCVWGPHLSIGN